MGSTGSHSSEPAPCWPVDTPGERFYAGFDPDTPFSREGQLVFFAQFIHGSQRWERFLQNCLLARTGNRGSKVVNVLGTAFMSVPAGHWCYANVNAIRGDAVNPSVLGMTSTVSKDVVCNAIKPMPEVAATQCFSNELLACVDSVRRPDGEAGLRPFSDLVPRHIVNVRIRAPVRGLTAGLC